MHNASCGSPFCVVSYAQGEKSAKPTERIGIYKIVIEIMSA